MHQDQENENEMSVSKHDQKNPNHQLKIILRILDRSSRFKPCMECNTKAKRDGKPTRKLLKKKEICTKRTPNIRLNSK